MLSVQKWKYMLLTAAVSAVLAAPVAARNPFKPVKRKEECRSILNSFFKKQKQPERKTDYERQDFVLLGLAGRKYIIKDKKTGNIFLRAEGEKFGNCVVTRGVLECY